MISSSYFDIDVTKKYSIKFANAISFNQFQIKKCEEVHNIVGLSDKKIKNIWTAFLVASIQMLKPKGVLAFILPSEILQVNYAKEIREFLKLAANPVKFSEKEKRVLKSLGYIK